MAKSLLTTSLSARMKLLQTGVSLYNTSHGFLEEEVKKILEQFPGGSIDLQKKQNGIGILTLNNPSKMNAFSGMGGPFSRERVTLSQSLLLWFPGLAMVTKSLKVLVFLVMCVCMCVYINVCNVNQKYFCNYAYADF